jgi:hypothetical protein
MMFCLLPMLHAIFLNRLKMRAAWNIECILPLLLEFAYSRLFISSLPLATPRFAALCTLETRLSACMCVVLNIALHFNATLKNIHLAWHGIFICIRRREHERRIYFPWSARTRCKINLPFCLLTRALFAHRIMQVSSFAKIYAGVSLRRPCNWLASSTKYFERAKMYVVTQSFREKSTSSLPCRGALNGFPIRLP